MAGEERIVVFALYGLDTVLPFAVEGFHAIAKNPHLDFAPLAEAISRESAAALKTEVIRTIWGRQRFSDADMESVVAAIELCFSALLDAAHHRDICDGRRSLRTRQERAFARAKAYINKWAQDRGLDFDRIRRLRRKAGAA